MFFCLSKRALAYIRALRDICNRHRHLSMQEGGSVTQGTLGRAGWGCSEGAAAKQEQAPQSWSCDGTFRSFSSEKRPKNKGWSSPWQLVLKQTDSGRGESVNAPGSTTAAGYKAPSQQEEPFTFVLAMNASAAAAVGLQENSCLTCLVF